MTKGVLAAALAFALAGGIAAAEDYGTEAEVDVNAQDQAIDVEAETDAAEAEEIGEPTAVEPTYTEDDTFTEVKLEEEEARQESGADMRGLGVSVAGGVESYSGSLAPVLQPGPAWGVNVAIKPSKVLGIEVGYSGATNEIDNGADGFNEGAVSGADIVRNGAHALATVGLTASPVQPYLLGGVGWNNYNVRGGFTQGFRDDSSGNIPLGGGLRAHMGNFIADARVNWNVLFDQEFATQAGTAENVAGVEAADAGRWNGMINLGATF